MISLLKYIVVFLIHIMDLWQLIETVKFLFYVVFHNPQQYLMVPKPRII